MQVAPEGFPRGIHVVVVDDDPVCLKVVERMLGRCGFRATVFTSSSLAYQHLKDAKDVDIVLSDVHMPDMDGFRLLELIGLELGLPVIMMSANGDTQNVLKGVVHGACDYLIKPVRMEELQNIWQHLVRRRKDGTVQGEGSGDVGEAEEGDGGEGEAEGRMEGMLGPGGSEGDLPSMGLLDSMGGPGSMGGGDGGEGRAPGALKRKGRDGDDYEEEAEPPEPGEQPSSRPVLTVTQSKKPRVVWTVEMHQQFVNAVSQLGIDKAVPKRILDLMNVEGLTRENVASHLQKYRLYLKRLQGMEKGSKAKNKGAQINTSSVMHLTRLPGQGRRSSGGQDSDSGGGSGGGTGLGGRGGFPGLVGGEVQSGQGVGYRTHLVEPGDPFGDAMTDLDALPLPTDDLGDDLGDLGSYLEGLGAGVGVGVGHVGHGVAGRTAAQAAEAARREEDVLAMLLKDSHVDYDLGL